MKWLRPLLRRLSKGSDIWMAFCIDDSPMNVPIRELHVSAYEVPTESPESDGTLVWNATTLVLVEAHAGGKVGLGYTYASFAAARLIRDLLAETVLRIDAMAVPSAWRAMTRAVRNLGQPGLSAMAIAAVDAALWDLKARLLDLPLVSLLGPVRESIPVDGSGGFTSYSIEELQSQFEAWIESGITQVKMKVGSNPDADVDRGVPHASLLEQKLNSLSTPMALTRASKPLPKQKRLPNSTSAGLRSRFLPMISKDCG
jgi:hypothetical protein